MPRKPDPVLEKKIVEVALALLDRHGSAAVSMREVAKAARTTTPTIYGRFKDHDALLRAVFDRMREELYPLLMKANTVEDMGDIFLQYGCQYPHRLRFMAQLWPKVMASGGPQPGLELLRSRLRSQFGHSQRRAEELSLSLFSLLLGTAVLMLGAGPGSSAAAALEKAGKQAFRKLCKL